MANTYFWIIITAQEKQLFYFLWVAFFSLLFYLNVNTVQVITIHKSFWMVLFKFSCFHANDCRLILDILEIYWEIKCAIWHPFSLILKILTSKNHLDLFFSRVVVITLRPKIKRSSRDLELHFQVFTSNYLSLSKHKHPPSS